MNYSFYDRWKLGLDEPDEPRLTSEQKKDYRYCIDEMTRWLKYFELTDSAKERLTECRGDFQAELDLD